MIAKVVVAIYGRLYYYWCRLYSLWKGWALQKRGKRFIACNPLYIFGGDKIIIGDNVRIERRTRLEAFSSLEYPNPDKIVIHDNVYINWNCHIGAINRVEIGEGSLIGSNVLITDHAHGNQSLAEITTRPIKRPLYSKGFVVIGQNVWIGENVCVLPNVNIGDNCIVGANSVVTHSFPKNVIIAGNPAKIIRHL